MKRKLSDTMIARGLRKKKMNEVRQLYAKFGDEVVQLMLHHALTPNGLRWVLQKLPIASIPTKDEQIHARIVQFIQERGVGGFWDVVRPPLPHKLSKVSGSSHKIPKPHSSSEPPEAVEIAPGSKSQAVHIEQRSDKYSFSGKERRKFQRQQTDVPARISITPSEKSRSSLEFKGAIRDISFFGLRLVVPNFPRSLYTVLYRSLGTVLVNARLPGNETFSQISGAIVWIDFCDEAPVPFSRMGIHIDRSSEETNREIEAAVRFLQDSTSG
jgi:hypothetical protein